MNAAIQILKEYWGYSSFRPLQEEIITSVLDGNDTVALLPTGGGKSLCFQLPAIAMEGICIVISPLIALMSDQVKQLKNKGIKALHLSGGLSFEEVRTLLDNAIYGNYSFLYLSPERLQQEMVQDAIRQMNVNLIAVDEAHCISQWGNDFRPAYKDIPVLRSLHPLVPFIALTATATPEVIEDTIAELQLEAPQVFKESFFRPNLAFKTYRAEDKLYQVEKLLADKSSTAIVYVRSRSKTVEVSRQLNSMGISATYYHGGISAASKKDRLQAWMDGKVSTIVATNAFGMGIDNPGVRFVIHLQIPESIESYFQEAGRAGRDGMYAEAVLLYNDFDKQLVQKQFVDSLPGEKDLAAVYRKLVNYFQIPYGEGEYSSHSFNFTEFCKTYNLASTLTFNALNTLDRLGILQLSKQFGQRSTLRFLVSSEQLLSYFERDIGISILGKTILRVYGGIFETATPVNISLLASKLSKSTDFVISGLKQMEKDAVAEVQIYDTDAVITFLIPREDEKAIYRLAGDVETLNKRKQQQVLQMLSYIENNTECKSLQLLGYFGETTGAACGICSVCTNKIEKKAKTDLKIVAKEILQLISKAPMSSRSIVENLTFTEAEVLKVLQALLDAKRLGINEKNEYYLK